ncbi:MAG: hypothetical protein JST93_15980 [Acidobacteria bacterium]|nr:hypothetical protein [Acidobacteriota bacterium]
MSSNREGMEVVVLFTDVPATLPALRTAQQFAQGPDTRIRVLMPQLVPYPLAVDKPAAAPETMERQFHALVSTAQMTGACIMAEIVLCRELWDALQARLRPHAVVVVGRRSGWWPKPEDRLAGRLRAAGHHVVRTAAAKGTKRWTFSTSPLAYFSSLFAGLW